MVLIPSRPLLNSFYFLLFLLQEVKKKYFSACLGFDTKYIHRPINSFFVFFYTSYILMYVNDIYLFDHLQFQQFIHQSLKITMIWSVKNVWLGCYSIILHVVNILIDSKWFLAKSVFFTSGNTFQKIHLVKYKSSAENQMCRKNGYIF